MKDCIAKLEKLHEEWRKLQKNTTRSVSPAQSKKVEVFKSSLDDLFDIAHQDSLMTTNEDRQFMLLQRQKGRPGCMGGVEIKFLRGEFKLKITDIEQIYSFLSEQLQKPRHQPREDYKEFLQLCVIFLGVVAAEIISFRAPGAMHHARWMAKAIYS